MKTKTVLVVEDERSGNFTLALVLRKAGHKVLQAYDGQEAWEALELARRKGRRIDLVVTDLLMPRMSGLDLVERLAASPERVPAVVISGYADAEAEAAARRAGCALLEKPFTAETLLQAVNLALEE